MDYKNSTSIQEEEDFEFEGDRGDSPFIVHMIAGSLAGFAEHFLMFPLDTIKTNMQTSKKYISFTHTIKSIYLYGGFFRFWKGSFLIGSASVPAHALYFSIYEYGKKLFGVEKSGFQFMASAMTGAIATFFHDIILTPADMIKQRIQISGSTKCLECVKNTIKNEGLLSFYRSLPITLIMNAPYSITTIVVNENLKKVVEPKKRKFKFLSYFMCAAVAGASASTITMPMDNIKTKLQTQSSSSICEKIDLISDKKVILGKNLESINDCKSDAQIKYKNIFSTVRLIYKEDGFFRGFFKGLTPQLMRNSPSCAISWVTYEMIKHFLIKNK